MTWFMSDAVSRLGQDTASGNASWNARGELEGREATGRSPLTQRRMITIPQIIAFSSWVRS